MDLDAIQNMSLEAIKARNKNPKKVEEKKREKSHDVDENNLLHRVEGVF